MSNKELVAKAIGAHGIWKAQLRAAIGSRKVSVPVVELRQEGLCEFGKWLLGDSMKSALLGGYGKEVRTLHAEFHRVAAQVAELALSGKAADAERMLSDTGEFSLASSKLTIAMMNWKNSL